MVFYPTFFAMNKFRLLSALTIAAALMLMTCSKYDDHPKPSENGRAYYGESILLHPAGPGLTLLKVQSYQQTTEYTCGPASVISLLNYYRKSGNEMTIAAEMGTSSVCGTTPDQMTSWLNNNGFAASWHESGNLDTIRKRLNNDKPILVEWSDWGGHWVLAIGYDSRNTETIEDDVIIFADPYDRHDDHHDGVTWFNAERFYYMWYDALLFGSVMRGIYIDAEPM